MKNDCIVFLLSHSLHNQCNTYVFNYFQIRVPAARIDCIDFYIMKLKDYLNPKRLMRRLSKSSINETYCNINDSFTDYNDNQLDIVSKDDMYLRPKKDDGAGYGTRTDMTQSFTGYLPSTYNYNNIESSDSSRCSSVISRATTSQSVVDTPSLTPHATVETCTCRKSWAENEYRMCPSCLWPYQSLPSHQTSHHIMSDLQYNSLPLTTATAVYIDNTNSSTASKMAAGRARSRIRTNPWLPLPKDGKVLEPLQRQTGQRAQPRLSRLFHEVMADCTYSCTETEFVIDKQVDEGGSIYICQFL